MKKITTAFVLSFSVMSLCANAQNITSNVPTGNFFDTVEGYFTSFNTNLDSTFATERLEVAIGVDSIQGGSTPLANSLRLSYTLYQPTNNAVAISAEDVVDNSGIAGTIVSEQLGVGLSFIIHDTKLTVYGDGLYDFNPKVTTNTKGKSHKDSPFGGEIGVRVEKVLTLHTFAGVGIGAVLPRNEQKAQVFTGFTF